MHARAVDIVSDRDVEGVRAAQRVARDPWEIVRAITPGMTERDAYDIARACFARHGIREHWHIPHLALGPGTTKLRSVGALVASVARMRQHLMSDDLVMVDIAPEVEGYPSDYTVTTVVGRHSPYESLCAFAREIAHTLMSQAERGATMGELLEQARALAGARVGHALGEVPIIHVGHRLTRLPAYWPRLPESRLLYLLLDPKPAFIARRRPIALRGFWSIEPYVLYAGRAAKHEEVVHIDPSGRLTRLNPD